MLWIRGDHIRGPMHDAELKDYLASFDLFSGAHEEEGQNYLNYSFRRLLLTLELIPPASAGDSKLLELGANPYFLTLLLTRCHAYRLHLANFFGEGHLPTGKGVQILSSRKYDERHEFAFNHFNVETAVFPYADETFDVVLMCEILEHLTADPGHALSEIHRVLKPGGSVIMTTPNVSACQNFLKLALGQNIYDCYSGYGVYGRHNREYTPAEILEFLPACHFAPTIMRVEDIHPHSRRFVRLLKTFRKQWRDNIFVQARKHGEAQKSYPDWLFRGTPER